MEERSPEATVIGVGALTGKIGESGLNWTKLAVGEGTPKAAEVEGRSDKEMATSETVGELEIVAEEVAVVTSAFEVIGKEEEKGGEVEVEELTEEYSEEEREDESVEGGYSGTAGGMYVLFKTEAIQSLYLETRVYTPGRSGRPHPTPQLVTPRITP